MGTLNHVGISHLFLVPNLRSSKYLSLLAEICPELPNSPKGNIQAEALPHLKVGADAKAYYYPRLTLSQHIVVVDNIHDSRVFHTELDNCKSAVDFREILVRDQSSWEEQQRKALQASLDKHDVINLQFTRLSSRPSPARARGRHTNPFLALSGTTGYPKAVSLTHHNLLNNALSIGDCMRLTEQDVLCNVPPLFHCFDECISKHCLFCHGTYAKLRRIYVWF